MIFLIEYDRPSGTLVTFEVFADSERVQAQESRLALELDRYRRGIRHEIVILEANNEAALRRTHGRYFETLTELTRKLLDALER